MNNLMFGLMMATAATVAFADPSVTVNKVVTANPWDSTKGAITVDYSLGGLYAECEHKVVFDISANGKTVSVTNDAAKLIEGKQAQKTIETVPLFGKETVDKDAKVKVSLIAVMPKEKGGVQLWKDGPFFAERNLGAEKPEDCGWYFWWGDTVGYTNSGSGWVSVVDGKRPIEFFSEYSPANSTFGKYNDMLELWGWISGDGNLTAEHDAATAKLGAPWRMPTSAELETLADTNVCMSLWMEDYNGTGVNGYLVTGVTAGYTGKSIFLPAAGFGVYINCFGLGTEGCYWSSTPYLAHSECSWRLHFASGSFGCDEYARRDEGRTVRPVRGVAE